MLHCLLLCTRWMLSARGRHEIPRDRLGNLSDRRRSKSNDNHDFNEEPIFIPPPGYPATKQYRICPACRAGNDPTSAFCQASGSVLVSPRPVAPPGKCRSCDFANPADRLFCASCGAKLLEATKRRCTSCDAPMAPAARFCSRCGQPALPASSSS